MLFGVPIAVFGFSWYLVIMVMAWKIYENDRNAFVWITLQFLWTVAGMIFVVYLLIAEIIVGAICPFCTVVHIIVTLQFYVAYTMFKTIKTQPSIRTMISTMNWWIPIFGSFFLLPMIYFNIPSSESPELIPQLDSFVRCLNKEGVAMYGSDSCHFCQRQKALFGTAFTDVKYVDCDFPESKIECAEKEIEALPTWLQFAADGSVLQRHTGLLTLHELSSTFSCPINT